jgi:pantetheine-phosphate adenylyltransferase
MRVCVGGTFNIFHKGHKLLIKTAIEQATEDGYLFIGITSGELVETKPQIRSFKERKKDLILFLINLQKKPEIVIKPISDIFGPTLKEKFDVIVVSPETKNTAEFINQKRYEKGLQAIHIIKIPYVLAMDGKPIQSSRIIAGEIDSNGDLINKRKKQN